ncbi:fibronectin type III domain-containing protein [Micromonospora mirobrigensis]|uniref:Fibronectin type III domain-containing protein n=1 Tax=Micromonospora mirobrigensis TaxID=262898 RepID=A0A1C4ZKI5_9ACTN|nr:fibronectin type III domain-containing protein [Micromonospora mirobrigensis]SCF33580.1 Fibronectin type III domain-containing protein [Micromonospora mirobrigensis]
MTPTDTDRRTLGARRWSRWLLLLLALCLLAAIPVSRARSVRTAPAGHSAQWLTGLFDVYGDTSGQWSGADRTASVRLPDGRLLWLFSDTFLGPVAPDGSRPRSTAFVNNSAVVQDGDRLVATVHGGTAEDPRALVPAAEADQFHWIGDAQVTGETLQVLVNRYRRTGSSPLDHQLLGTSLATFALPALTPTGVRPLPLDARVSWGSELLRDGDHTYVYGTEAAGETKFAHVARVRGTDLSGPWEFWTGRDWSTDDGASARVLSGVGTSYGVQRVDGRYVLVTHENNLVFSADLVAYTAAAPTGPFDGPDYLYTAPETDAGHLVYDADLHPELARPGKLLLSYNVNDVDDAVTYADTKVYRPRFVEVDWPPRRPESDGLPPAPTGLAARPAAAGTAALTWSAPRTDDDLRYQVHRRDVTAGQTHLVRIGEPGAEPRFSSDFLVNGHEYEFAVSAIGRHGEGPPSPVSRMTATVPPPPPPGGLRAEPGGAGDVTLNWEAVPFVRVYRVQQRDLATGVRTTVGTFTGTHATVEFLRHARTYEFSVVAVGGGGASRPSAPVRATAVVTPPAAPSGLTATPRPDGTIRVTWRALGPGISYRVYRRDLDRGQDLGLPALESEATHVARNLEHDHRYEFTVAAINSGGEGARADPVTATARFTPPTEAPRQLRAEAGAGSVELTWRSSIPGGWHRVYRRDLTAGDRDFTEEPVPTQGTRATVVRLTNDHEYEFAVAAMNQAGPGPRSEPVRVTPRLPVPTGLTVAAAGNGEARLLWRSAGPGFAYRVQLRDVTLDEQWRTDPYPVQDVRHTAVFLTRGHRYEFRVTVTDGVTDGEPTAPVAVQVS